MPRTKPLRSMLFVPGNKARMLEKARMLPADAVILDLEDGVAVGEKEAARETIRAALEAGPFAPFTVVRVNGLGTGLTGGDVQATLRAGVDAISAPKVESAGQVRQVEALVAQVERERGLPEGETKLVLFVETALGVLRSFEIATASERVIALAFGAEDLCRDIGAVRTASGSEVAQARAQLVLAARAAGVLPIDTVYTAVRDTDGLAAEARLARQWGFAGKLAIHPAQIEPINRAFTPSEEEVAYARRVVEAFEAAEAAGSGVAALDGQMIDAPVVARARGVLALAGVVR